jgi:signal transduction histidine kinase
MVSDRRAGLAAASTALRAPFAAETWAATLYCGTGMVMGALSFAVMAAMLWTSVSLLVVALLGVPLLWLTFAVARQVAVLDASRAQVFLGEDLRLRKPPETAGDWLERWWSRTTWVGSWIEVGYAVVVLPVSALLHGTIVMATWGGGLAFVLFPLYGGRLAGAGTVFTWDVGLPMATVVHVTLGTALLLVAPWVARASASGCVGLSRAVLSPNDRAALVQRVETLEDLRSRMLAAADAERRRIERDLHDGAQQRLVAVAMALGRAKTRMDDDPVAARRLVEEAHADAKQALTELRDLARGLHPAVLADRGLDAALSALAARSPVAVSVEVADDVTREPRPDRNIEAVAYFVVAEALTNVAKHSRARHAWVVARRDAERLELEIRDDGVGGAAARRGSGLAGLNDRVRSVDGVFDVTSPAGGPTTIRVELPCAS